VGQLRSNYTSDPLNHVQQLGHTKHKNVSNAFICLFELAYLSQLFEKQKLVTPSYRHILPTKRLTKVRIRFLADRFPSEASKTHDAPSLRGREFLPRAESGRCVKLTTHIQLPPTIRMSGPIPPRSQTS
jgi:hypothetical protein